MGQFSCHGCQRPEKGPTCHGTCLVYAEEKAAHEERRLAQQRVKCIQCGLNEQTARGVRQANRRRK